MFTPADKDVRLIVVTIKLKNNHIHFINSISGVLSVGCFRVRRCENSAFVPTVAKLMGASPKLAVERVAWWCLSPLGPLVC